MFCCCLRLPFRRNSLSAGCIIKRVPSLGCHHLDTITRVSSSIYTITRVPYHPSIIAARNSSLREETRIFDFEVGR